MMAVHANDEFAGAGTATAQTYPLKETAGFINDRLGLYLSDDQQQGLATGLLIGTAVGAAILAWNIATVMRGRD